MAISSELPVAELGYEPASFLDGKWKPARDGRTYAVENPSTGQSIQNVALCGRDEATEAIEAAEAALAAWAGLSGFQRAEYLGRIHQLIQEYREPLARIAVLEQGMPLPANRGAVDYAATFFRWYAEEARRVYGRTISHPDPSRRLRVDYVPCGVAGIITPWNGPLGSPAKKVAAALAAGCTVVLKPSELTPLSSLAMAALCQKAQLPPGVFNVVSGDAQAIGQALLQHPAVRIISFTGSLRTGRMLYTEAAREIKKVTLELGGNAPYIIFNDARLDTAIEDLVGLKMSIAGQLCVTANRVYVQKDVFAYVAERLSARFGTIRVGDGFAPGVQMGPLIHRDAAQRVAKLVEDSVAGGGRLLCGGRRSPSDSSFYLPTVVAEPPADSDLVNEEIFGPVIPLLPFDSEERVLAEANATPFRLAAYAYTESHSRAERLCRQLDFGCIGLNDPRPVTCEAPFGGMGLSGLGREGGIEGMQDFLECKLIGERSGKSSG